MVNFSMKKKELEELKSRVAGNTKQLDKINQTKADSATLSDKEKELQSYIAKLEGIISGYAVSFNNTLSSYKSAIKDEVRVMSDVALE